MARLVRVLFMGPSRVVHTLYMHRELLHMVAFMSFVSAAVAVVFYGCEVAIQVVFMQLAVFECQLRLFQTMSFVTSVSYLAVPAVVSDYVFHSQGCPLIPFAAAATRSVCFLPFYFLADVDGIQGGVVVYVSAFGISAILTFLLTKLVSVCGVEDPSYARSSDCTKKTQA
jgi:hypothetical protein